MKRLFALCIALPFILSGCGQSKNTNNKSMQIIESSSPTQSSATAMPTEQRQSMNVIYADDDIINKFLNNYNNVNNDNRIASENIEKYSLHGKSLDDQIRVIGQDYDIVISNEFSKIKVYIQAYSYNGRAKTDDDFKELYLRFAKGFNPSLSTDEFNSRWQQTIDAIGHRMKFEEYELSISIIPQKNGDDWVDEIENITLEGNLK